MKRRVYIAYAGGTFGMRRTPEGYVPEAGLARRLAGVLPASGADGMPEWVLREYERPIDSAEARPQDWYAIAADIAAHYDAFDGFVVIHGTDTMAYAASALSFALAGLRKPVVVTGAQIPLGEPRSDAGGNLLGALLIAARQPLPEVCLYFDGRLLRGNRATKVSSTDFDAFDSPNYPPLGRAGITIGIDRCAVRPMPAREAFEIVAPSAHEIGVLPLHPALSVARLERMLAPPLAALVLQTYGAGNGPVRLPGFAATIAEACGRGVVVVGISQCARGGVSPATYATGSALARAGVVAGADLTLEAALTKLVHLFALGLAPQQIRARMAQPLCGECRPPADAGTDA